MFLTALAERTKSLFVYIVVAKIRFRERFHSVLMREVVCFHFSTPPPNVKTYKIAAGSFSEDIE